MTQPSEVVVTDEEISAIYKFCDELDMQENAPPPRQIFRQALAAFLAARVPDAGWDDPFGAKDTDEVRGFNACRARVLKGE